MDILDSYEKEYNTEIGRTENQFIDEVSKDIEEDDVGYKYILLKEEQKIG